MTMPRGSELLIILFIVLLLFGARRLPDLAESLRRSRQVLREGEDGSDAEEGRDTPARSDGTDDPA